MSIELCAKCRERLKSRLGKAIYLPKGRNHKSADTLRRVKRMLARGATPTEIAYRLDLTTRRIWQIMKLSKFKRKSLWIESKETP